MRKLQKFANWKTILPFFILTLVFSFVVFPHYNKERANIAGQEAGSPEIKSLDARIWGYDLSEVNTFFDAIGSEGLKCYRFVESRIDMAYPIVYGSFFVFAILFFTNKWKNKNWVHLAYLPVIASLADYRENIGILKLIDAYPKLTAQQVNFISSLTQIKCLLLSLSFIVVLILLLVWLYQLRRQTT